jgi:hypothetical protein
MVISQATLGDLSSSSCAGFSAWATVKPQVRIMADNPHRQLASAALTKLAANSQVKSLE